MAFVGNAIALAIGTCALCEIDRIRDRVVVAIFALIRHAVAVEIGACAVREIDRVFNAIDVAIGEILKRTHVHDGCFPKTRIGNVLRIIAPREATEIDRPCFGRVAVTIDVVDVLRDFEVASGVNRRRASSDAVVTRVGIGEVRVA